MDLNFIVSLTISIFMFILGIIFIVQSVIKKRKAYVFTASMFIGMIASLIEVFRTSMLPNLDFNSSVLLVTHLSFWCLMYLLSLIFFIQLEREKILCSSNSYYHLCFTHYIWNFLDLLWFFSRASTENNNQVLGLNLCSHGNINFYLRCLCPF